MTRDATTSFARTLVDEWARAGVTDAVLAPGSRSAPLALALAADDRITVHVHVDERAAGGFALGLARGSRRPAILVCTSGTAAALYHSAVLEAHHGGVPLVVCTADRPPELHDVGAGQTIEQRALYGDALRWSADPGPPDDRPGVGAVWRGIAARAVDAATGPPAGPVHLNLAFREPLVPTGEPLVDAPGRADGGPWTTTRRPRIAPDAATVEALAAFVRHHPARRGGRGRGRRDRAVGGWSLRGRGGMARARGSAVGAARRGARRVDLRHDRAPRRHRQAASRCRAAARRSADEQGARRLASHRRADLARRSGRAVARPGALGLDTLRVRPRAPAQRGGRSTRRTLRR